MAQSNGLILSDPTRQIPGVPHRDLTHDEVEAYGGYDVLVTSGVYTYPSKKAKSSKKDK